MGKRWKLIRAMLKNEGYTTTDSTLDVSIQSIDPDGLIHWTDENGVQQETYYDGESGAAIIIILELGTTMTIGNTQKLKAENDTGEDITTECYFTSNDTKILTVVAEPEAIAVIVGPPPATISNDTKILTVVEGGGPTITAIASGSATITATYGDDSATTDPITVISNLALINGFDVPGQNGTTNIDPANISVSMPEGSDLTAIEPIITVSLGATVIPASQVSRDFTSAVTYVVTSEDEQKTTEYTVKIRRIKNSIETTGTTWDYEGVMTVGSSPVIPSIGYFGKAPTFGSLTPAADDIEQVLSTPGETVPAHQLSVVFEAEKSACTLDIDGTEYILIDGGDRKNWATGELNAPSPIIWKPVGGTNNIKILAPAYIAPK